MSWLVPLLLYAILATLGIGYFEYRRRDDAAPYLRPLRRLDLTPLTAKERADTTIAIAKIEQEDVPWYNRAISKVGVVAFITSAIAAGVQTITASVEARKVDALRAQVEEQHQTLQRGERILNLVAESILAKMQEEGRGATEDEREILAERRKQLRAEAKPTDTQCAELLRLSLGLRDAAAVVRTVKLCPNVPDSANAADRVAMAVYSYFAENDAAARVRLAGLGSLPASVPIIYRAQVIVLSALLEPQKMDEWVRSYAALMKIEHSRARVRLTDDVQKMRQDKASQSKLDLDNDR